MMLRAGLISRFKQVRQQSARLCQPLAIEEYVIQAMPDVSPPKWHLAHVTWFFETFFLLPFFTNYQPFNPDYKTLFNSYYESLGNFFPRAQRGFLARPTVQEIYDYRQYVDQHLLELLDRADEDDLRRWQFVLELGIQHEQQHQELLLMDVKYNNAINPLRPIYSPAVNPVITPLAVTAGWQQFSAGLYEIGHAGQEFSFDNETPRHAVRLEAFEISKHLVSNADYLAFIADQGYKKPEYWFSDGWQLVKKEQWQAPLYWQNIDGKWWNMTLQGMQPLIMQQPVCHLSYYEADAFANWAKARLPTEAEWEVAASHQPLTGNFLESRHLHPQAAAEDLDLQFFGEVWQWTRSAYAPYPGYKPFAGAFVEYNSKFACNQFVLRGGCIITPETHIRLSYRNFFYPQQRWPFTGMRLARDL